jgi:7-cyano-7-deazaguanine synthase
MNPKKKVVLILSGGMDSTTMLYWYVSLGYEVHAISFDYGQRHSRELHSASDIATAMGVEHKIIELPIWDLLKGSSQTDQSVEVPEGHYAEESMKKTVVPNRNMIMLSVAGAWAVSLKAEILAYGAHAGDHDIYPDCRWSFVEPMTEAFQNCDWHKVRLEAPFLHLNKTQIAMVGSRLGVPYDKTYTCYNGRAKHCGKCGACQERREAFRDSQVADPTQYEEVANVVS